MLPTYLRYEVLVLVYSTSLRYFGTRRLVCLYGVVILHAILHRRPYLYHFDVVIYVTIPTRDFTVIPLASTFCSHSLDIVQHSSST